MKRFWVGVLAALFASVCSSLGQIWVSNNVSPQQWTSIACSADGTKLNATVYGGPIYSSTNSGATWSTNGAGVNNWNSIASSTDGNRLAAAVYGGGIYTSSDSGASWKMSSAPSTSWIQVVSSANGLKLFAAPSSGSCYYSTNAGTNWSTLSTPLAAWTSISCSANGNILVAVVSQDNPPVYISTNAGAAWITNRSIIGQPGAGIAASADAGKLFLLTVGFTYESTDFGVSWVRKADAGTCNRVVCSADGNALFAAQRTLGSSSNYTAYVSTNSGSSWISQTVSNTYNNSLAHVIALAMSADAGKLMLGNGETGASYTPNTGHSSPIYSSATVVSPTLNVGGSSNKLSLGWVIPSTNFILEGSADLSTWASVTNAATLNLTNLQYQLVLPATNSDGFFRLATP